MTDPISGKSRCFGFVRFTEELERQRALVEMNGVWFAGRPLRVALATPRTTGRRYQQQQQQLQQPQISLSHHQQQQQQQQQSAPPFLVIILLQWVEMIILILIQTLLHNHS